MTFARRFRNYLFLLNYSREEIPIPARIRGRKGTRSKRAVSGLDFCLSVPSNNQGLTPTADYTLLVSGVASHAVAPALSPKFPFDPVRDFAHIALFGGPPSVLAVHPSLPAKDLKSFIAFAKSKPRELTYGSPGNGTQGHLIAELFKRSAGIDIQHIPYKGASGAMVDVIAGHTHAISTTLTTAGTHIRSGRLRALAISSAARLPDYDVPTFREAGYPELVASIWFSLSGPAALSPEIVNRLNSEVRRALQLPDVRARLRTEGIEPGNLDPKAFTEFVAAEVKRWAPVVKASGARAD